MLLMSKMEDARKKDSHTFYYLKRYAEFLLKDHMDALVKESVKKALSKNFPFIKLLKQYSEKELFEIFWKGFEEQILVPVINNKPFDKMREKIEAWKENSAIISKNALSVQDILDILNVRKETLLDFLERYNCSKEEIIHLTKEINRFFDEATSIALKAFEEVQSVHLWEENFSPDSDLGRQHGAGEQFINLVERVRDYAIFMLNPDGTIATWNEGAKRLKGYSEKEIIGKHFSIFYPQEKREEKFPEYELKKAAKVGRFEDEGWRVKKDGSVFWANVVITAIFNKEKKLLGFTKITRDLTERKQFEESHRKINMELDQKVKERTEELSKTVKNLTKINNDLDNFIYTASHDLKAPISNIEGLLNGLYDELGDLGKKDPAVKAFRKMLDASIQRFQATIKELTEIAKIQKGSLENAEEVDLDELLHDVKFSIQELIKKNKATVLSDFTNCKNIKFVKKNLKSVIYNLVSNGIKYRSPEREPVVTLKCSEGEKNYILSCEDNGLGIKEENIEKLFTMFKRFHDHVEGSGVGLYIVKRIIENSGGTIEVKSREGEGSVFIICIPKV